MDLVKRDQGPIKSTALSRMYAVIEQVRIASSVWSVDVSLGAIPKSEYDVPKIAVRSAKNMASVQRLQMSAINKKSPPSVMHETMMFALMKGTSGAMIIKLSARSSVLKMKKFLLLREKAIFSTIKFLCFAVQIRCCLRVDKLFLIGIVPQAILMLIFEN